MSRTHRTLPALAALLAAGLVPAVADAADATYRLGGAPRMVLADAHHATIRFASDRLPKTSSGRYRATIRFATGTDARVTTIRATGRHGDDVVYTAKVRARDALKAGRKYRLTFILAGSKPQRVFVKAYGS